MKATGMVRGIDDLGRVCIPKEIRMSLDIGERDSVEIFLEGDNMILRKYQPDCIFCNSMEDLRFYKGKPVCKSCRKQLKA